MREFPDDPDHFPLSDGLDLKKLKGGDINTDSCSDEQKAHRVLSNVVGGEVWDKDCHCHLHNVWFKAMEETLTRKLNQILKDEDLEEIVSELCVTTSFSAIAHAYDKGFSCNANYVKCFGKDYTPWLKKNKPQEPM